MVDIRHDFEKKKMVNIKAQINVPLLCLPCSTYSPEAPKKINKSDRGFIIHTSIFIIGIGNKLKLKLTLSVPYI